MTVTAVVAVCSIAICEESPWTRATLSTVTLTLFLSSLIRTAICRGEDQAFAIGYAISSFFYLMSLYTTLGLETLPLLITQELWSYLNAYSAKPMSEEHFFIVTGLCWALVFAYSGGMFAKQWYRRRIKQMSHNANESVCTSS